MSNAIWVGGIVLLASALMIEVRHLLEKHRRAGRG
jgi:hypothetical protein